MSRRPAKRSKQDEEELSKLEADEDVEDEYTAGPSESSKASDLYLDTVSST